MKKILAVVIAALMIFQSFGVFATEAEADFEFGPFNVKTDIALEVSGNGRNFKDEVKVDTGDNVDFIASIDMGSVRDEFERLYALIGAENAEFPADDIALSGNFTLTLTFPTKLTLSKDVVNNSELDGFTAEAADLFVEVSRELVTGDGYDSLVIELAVKDGVKVGDISADLEDVLVDFAFEGVFKNVKKGEFTITGELDGEVVGTFTDDDELTYLGVVSFEENEVAEAIIEASGSSGSGSSGGGRLPGNHSTKPNGSFAGDTAIVALYNDVNEAHWAYAYIEKMAREGIMNGTGNYQFEPEAPLTRAAVVKMLASLVKAEVAQSSLTFYDVPQSEWYNPYVAWGVANGIVTGYSDTEFAPDKAITRQELAAMIVRFLGKYNVFCPVTTEKAAFADDAAIEAYAYDAVYTLQMAGILNGKGDNMFAPADNTTRAEAAKVFSFIVDLYK